MVLNILLAAFREVSLELTDVFSQFKYLDYVQLQNSEMCLALQQRCAAHCLTSESTNLISQT
jgi:hypothetical protein